MKAISGMENVKAAGEAQERLPVGGYILKVLNAEVLDYSWGSVLKVDFDIAEGDYAGYYAEGYKMQQQEDKKWKGSYRMVIPKEGDDSDKNMWTMRNFKRDYEALEDSNKGYHWDWDESKLKGKLVGGVFHDCEYDINGANGFYTACHHFTSVENIKEEKFRVPKPRMLKRDNAPDGLNVGDFKPLDDAELPF